MQIIFRQLNCLEIICFLCKFHARNQTHTLEVRRSDVWLTCLQLAIILPQGAIHSSWEKQWGLSTRCIKLDRSNLKLKQGDLYKIAYCNA